MADTKIEWSDKVWNPVTGCTKVSQGCKNCYAERLWPKVSASEANRLGWERRRAFTEIRCHRERLETPLHWARPQRVFVNSMSDLFHEDVPESFIVKVFAVMGVAQRHTFQILTKRADRMRWLIPSSAFKQAISNAAISDHLDWQWPQWPLPNVWLGVSVEDQANAAERIPLLLQTPAAVRFISAEPLLGPIDIAPYLTPHPSRLTPHLNWVIAGGESGPEARPSHPDWFRSLRDQCKAVGVAFFFKQWGEWAPMRPMEALAQKRRGIAIDSDGNAPSPAEFAQMTAGDFSCLRGRIQLVRVGKKEAGRLLDGNLHDDYPA